MKSEEMKSFSAASHHHSNINVNIKKASSSAFSSSSIGQVTNPLADQERTV